MGCFLKGKNLLPKKQILSFKSRSLFRRGNLVLTELFAVKCLHFPFSLGLFYLVSVAVRFVVFSEAQYKPLLYNLKIG